MANRKRKPSALDVTGLKIKDIIAMTTEDLQHLKEADAVKIASRLVSAANKRIKRLEADDMAQYAPALIARKNKGLFSVRGLNLGQVQKVIKVTKAFLQSETSTLKGFKKFRREMINRIGGDFESIEQERKFWNTYNKYLDQHYNQVKGNSPQFQQAIYELLVEKGYKRESTITKKLDAILDKTYEVSEELEHQRRSELENDIGFVIEDSF